jgi:hypothetical protein
MMGMFVTSCIGTLSYSGKDSYEKSQKLRQQIQDANKSTQVLKSKYDDLVKTNVEIDASVKNDIINALDQHIKLSAEINKNNNSFNDTLKKIELVGIVFVAGIFLLLLLKNLKIIDINLFSKIKNG